MTTNIKQADLGHEFTHCTALQIHIVVANLEPNTQQVDERDIVSNRDLFVSQTAFRDV